MSAPAGKWRCGTCGRYLHHATVTLKSGTPSSRCSTCGPVVALYGKGPGPDPQDAKVVGQEQSLLDLPEVSTATFLHIVESVPPGAEVSVNTLRERLDASQVPERARGALFAAAMCAGLLERVHLVDVAGRSTPYRVPSTGYSAHRAPVQVYRRTAARALADAS